MGLSATYTMSDLRWHRIIGPGDTGLYCNSIRATSDIDLYVNVKATYKKLILYKITFNEADTTSVAFEERIYRPTFSTLKIG